MRFWRLSFLAALSLGQAARASAWPALSEAPRRRGADVDDAALIVGVADYDKLPDVPGAEENARDWYTSFTRSQGLSVGNVRVLLGEEATREGILHAAEEIAARSGRGARTWVIFIGHGAPSRDGRAGALVGADARANTESLWARSVRQGELLSIVERGAQDETLMIVDACFSGQSAAGESLAPGSQFAVPARPATGGAVVLSAARADEIAGPLPGLGRPAFSYLLLGALRGWADGDGDGQITSGEALDYTHDVIFAAARGRRQTPTLAGPRDVLLARGREAGPDVAAMVVSARPAVHPAAVGAETDLQALARAAERAAAARRDAEARAAALEERLRDERDALLSAAADALATAATEDWRALAPLAMSETPEAREVLSAFVAEYDRAQVTVDGERRRVKIPQVAEALKILGRESGGAARAPRSPAQVEAEADATWRAVWETDSPELAAWRLRDFVEDHEEVEVKTRYLDTARRLLGERRRLGYYVQTSGVMLGENVSFENAGSYPNVNYAAWIEFGGRLRLWSTADPLVDRRYSSVSLYLGGGGGYEQTPSRDLEEVHYIACEDGATYSDSGLCAYGERDAYEIVYDDVYRALAQAQAGVSQSITWMGPLGRGLGLSLSEGLAAFWTVRLSQSAEDYKNPVIFSDMTGEVVITGDLQALVTTPTRAGTLGVGARYRPPLGSDFHSYPHLVVRLTSD